MSIEDVRAGLAATNEKVDEATGAAQQAETNRYDAHEAFIRATEGSGAADVAEVNGLYAQAEGTLQIARQQISEARAAIDGIAARLGGGSQGYLIQEGTISYRTEPRQSFLGCLACQLFRKNDGRALPTEMSSCTRTKISNVSRNLQVLSNARILESDKNAGRTTDDTYYSGRTYYGVADTPQGRRFAAILKHEIPPECGLEVT